MTLIDLEWLFHVKVCLRAALSGFSPCDSAIFENNCVETNEDRDILSAAEIFDGTLVSESVRFARIHHFNNQSLPHDAQIYRKKLTVLHLSAKSRKIAEFKSKFLGSNFFEGEP